MRIAYVINSVEGGGAALPVPAVTRVLRAGGAHVELFALTRRDGRALAAMHESGLRTHVRPGGEKDHLAALGWLEQELGAWRPDVIWTSLSRATLLGQIVGERLSVPVVSWQHAAYLKPANRLLLRARQKASAIWVADSYSVFWLTGRRLRVPPERLMLWPLFAADPGAPVASPWKPGEPLRIGSLGRLHPVKGYDVLIAALARLRSGGLAPTQPFEVSVAGDGVERAQLESQIAAAGLSEVRLVGYQAEPRGFLAGLHLYLQPSRSEGLCIAVHEAMQAGLPAIVSAVGELPHSIVDGESGLVVPPGDVEALAHALAWALGHPERLAQMGREAREHALLRFSARAFEDAGAAILSHVARPASAEVVALDRSAAPPPTRRSA